MCKQKKLKQTNVIIHKVQSNITYYRLALVLLLCNTVLYVIL